MAQNSAAPSDNSPHIPVLLAPILAAVAPVTGVWLDGTFGAGGYTRALLEAGAKKVLAVDRDPEVFERAKVWAGDYGDKLVLIDGEFASLDQLARSVGEEDLSGIVLDIGVSSMQIDQAERGFSFAKQGPLDMRMSQEGISAADIVNGASEAELADILFQYGEEKASRRIAKAIIAARGISPITTTDALATVIETSLAKPKPGSIHPATRSFQALRIAVNDELLQLVNGLMAAERALAEGGILAVVTFHSLEDRIVKRFMAARCGAGPKGNRFAPETTLSKPRFEKITRKAITASAEEIAANPRARSAKLRMVRRTAALAEIIEYTDLGLPGLALRKAT